MSVYLYLFNYIFLPLFVIKVLLNYEHFLVTLLSVEFISMSLYFLLSLYIYYSGAEFYFLFYFLVVVVCEGVLGLSLLVMFSQSYGSDFIRGFNFLSC